MAGGLSGIFKKSESLISVDVGSAGIKLMEVDISGARPKLLNIAFQAVNADLFSNNAISKPEKVGEYLTSILESNEVGDKRAVVAMPGPSVFTKKIKMDRAAPNEMASNVQFEAGNFIPHNIEAVKIDYHVVGESGKNQLDVLVVAVKNEIIDSYVNALGLAGLETAVVDVDHFAVQNMFEMCYPEDTTKTVALINMGARYSSINICRDGGSLFTGDISIGGKLFTETLINELGISAEDAEAAKRGNVPSRLDAAQVQEVIDKNIEYVASEFNRQLSFFWNASGAEDGIDKIVVCGGGGLVKGLIEELAEKTGIETSLADPLRGITVGGDFDAAYLKEIGPLMSVCAGMAIRQPGDRIETN